MKKEFNYINFSHYAKAVVAISRKINLHRVRKGLFHDYI